MLFHGQLPDAADALKQKLGGHAAENGEAQVHAALTPEMVAAMEAADADAPAAEQPVAALQTGVFGTEMAETNTVMAEPEEVVKAL